MEYTPPARLVLCRILSCRQTKYLSDKLQESELAARRADYDRRMNGMVELGGGKVAVYGVCSLSQ